MVNRRDFLGAIGLPAATMALGGFACTTLNPRRASAIATNLASHKGAPDAIAQNEDFWFEVARAFTVDRSLMNLNNGGVSPSPRFVQEAMKRHLDFSNTAPSYALWRVLEPQREPVRERFARTFGCDPEEVAFTRNASESLQTCQFGLDLKSGDEVLTTTQDYPRMMNTFRQRERREGIVLKTFSVPVPAENPQELVSLFEQHITSKTRLILVSHMINLTGQILPVKQIAAMARRKGIPVIVDGAHSLAHFDFRLDELNCDYFGSSLHKWLFAPHGTGLLYVRKNKIADLWPLMAANEDQVNDIRKFEEIGTHPAANYLAIGEALTFHQGIGAKRKQARLIYLRNYWAKRLMKHARVTMHTSLKPGHACGIANIQLKGIDSGKLNSYLWKEHRIITTPIKHEEFEGIRVSPSVYTTLWELDRFIDVMEHIVKNGLPT